MLKMDTFNYATEAELFDYGKAELFSTRSRKVQRQPLGYKRFARAADAIRFARSRSGPAGASPQAPSTRRTI